MTPQQIITYFIGGGVTVVAITYASQTFEEGAAGSAYFMMFPKMFVAIALALHDQGAQQRLYDFMVHCVINSAAFIAFVAATGAAVAAGFSLIASLGVAFLMYSVFTAVYFKGLDGLQLVAPPGFFK